MLNIPPLDLQAQYREIGPEIDAAIARVLESGHYVLGNETRELEREVSMFCTGGFDIGYGVGVASGTDALLLALRAAGVGPGDEVITSPFSFVATAAAISRTGATPVFADIDPETFLLDLQAARRAVTERTKAIMPVHLYGRMVSMENLWAMLYYLRNETRQDLVIIHDAAQAIGATSGEETLGEGLIKMHQAALSFYPTKNLGAAGDGGMVLTNSVKVARDLDILRRQGSPAKYHADRLGYNSRLDEIQAAILRVKLRHLPDWTARRRHLARLYLDNLRGIPVTPPAWDDGHVWHQFTIRETTGRRDELVAYLKENGVGAMVYYPVPIHRQALYANAWQDAKLPHAEQAAREVLSLPIYPEMGDGHVVAVCKVLRRFYRAD